LHRLTISSTRISGMMKRQPSQRLSTSKEDLAMTTRMRLTMTETIKLLQRTSRPIPPSTCLKSLGLMEILQIMSPSRFRLQTQRCKTRRPRTTALPRMSSNFSKAVKKKVSTKRLSLTTKKVKKTMPRMTQLLQVTKPTTKNQIAPSLMTKRLSKTRIVQSPKLSTTKRWRIRARSSTLSWFS